jgi:UDP-4-amino-4,6-dideoxy-N-acetyl-beta-L-altrosamine transaminase
MDCGQCGEDREDMMIPYGRQDITDADIAAVVAVLRSDFITQGPVIEQFERAVLNYCGAKYGVAVNSATSALHIACLAMGLGSGDYLWTTPNTFVASANCGLYCGAMVDFVDIDPNTNNMSVDGLADKLALAKQQGKLPKIVVPVHLCGTSCDMAAIKSLADIYSFKIIEDASHAIGGKYRSEPVGGCHYSDITVFSFHPVKIITTAEGGLAVTNDAGLAQQMQLFRSHGITRDPGLMTHEPDGPWYYQQVELGYNYRMTELQAALGLSQMARLDQYVVRRHEIAACYDELFANLPIVTPSSIPDSYSALHLYVIRLNLAAIAKTHRQVFESLRAKGVGVNLHYIPVHTQPYYQALGHRPGDYPEAERYYAEAISLPMYPAMTEEQITWTADAVKAALFE